MARDRLSMKKIKEILRLKTSCGLSCRQIARSCEVSRPVVSEYLEKAGQAGLISWEEIAVLSEEELEMKLNIKAEIVHVGPSKAMPDYAEVHKELRNKHVTLTLLWQEYKEEEPGGYEYVQYCNLYRAWKEKQDYCMRQEHKGGEKLFVDYCDGITITDKESGEKQKTELFAAVWGASNYTYAEASLSQDLYCWTGSHVNAVEYFKCVPHIVVPDNLKSGISKPCRYEPLINESYKDLGRHYNFAVIPARVRKPRDKAKVEAGVLIAQRWILAALRHRQFFSLVELNVAIAELLEKLNGRLMRKLKVSRRELFEQIDHPNAKALPERAWEYCEWKKARVNLDYHVQAQDHYYSVPCRLVHSTVDLRITAAAVEVFWKGERIASHLRSLNKFKHTTVKEHMPKAHQEHAQWTPERIIEWAGKTGPWTALLVKTMLESRAHPEQAYRSALGIIRLGNKAGMDRVENACRRAVEHRSCSYKSVRSILDKGMDRCGHDAQPQLTLPVVHENIRGSGYYN